MDLDSIILACQVPKDLVFAVYIYGSRVYGTNTPDSDYDIFVVASDEYFKSTSVPLTEEVQYRLENPARDITVYSEAHMLASLDLQEIKSIELVLSPDEFKLLDLKEYKNTLKLDLINLRHAVSAKCDHSWTKAMKKLTVEKDFAPTIAKKSLFHSFRMNQFALDLVQCHKDGRPLSINFRNESVLELYREIMNDESEDWEHYKQKFKTRYNAAKSKLRQMIPKS
eukprot:TRINITY_DN13510_c0_g1_i1.p1 TRINITY_DN13510_c0_g1~~TRINITY_DN13510_c0_g1_i1.p1  ORF type:complete len:225 (-),score=26.25 TRINITY_DN13510_c0_g1_i1:631-1305(-)